ncbi:DUF1292 domain-containing protein [Hathewaya limosa]|nr:DUF1292 domain-containing protein [Hathewaya limosa]
MDKEHNCNCHEEMGCNCGEHTHNDECGCGCGCDDMEVLTVELEDENGNVVTCEIIDGFDYKEKEYAVVVNPEDDSYYIFRVEGVEGDEESGELVVPEEKEFDEVRDYYENLLAAEEE